MQNRVSVCLFLEKVQNFLFQILEGPLSQPPSARWSVSFHPALVVSDPVMPGQDSLKVEFALRTDLEVSIPSATIGFAR